MYNNVFVLYRVFSTVHFTALSISQVSSIAPDLTKAKVSAIRILTLLKRKPQIDASCGNGIILVATNLFCVLSLPPPLSLASPLPCAPKCHSMLL